MTRSLIITGGGCYGAHYVRQLAPVSGATIRVLDRDPLCLAAVEGAAVEAGDWDDLLDRRLRGWEDAASVRRGQWLIPAPLTPHLFARWLGRALSSFARLEEMAPPLLPETPFARVTDTKLVFSFADWPCPTHCVEPALCPATRQPKSWDLGRELAAYGLRLREAGLVPLAGPFVARLAPVGRGVSGFPLSDWARAARRVRSLVSGVRPRSHAYVVAATVSSCHGAASMWRVMR